MGSGTISGDGEGKFGSMLELSWKGAKEVVLREGERSALFSSLLMICCMYICEYPSHLFYVLLLQLAHRPKVPR